jgi:hypothetical protein
MEEKMMGYVIKLNHRKGHSSMYVGGVQVATDRDDYKVRAMELDGWHVNDVENTPFETLEEASQFPYPTAEAATAVILSLPKTENIDYELVATGDESMESWTEN